jgi:hypothetical protein
VKDNIKVDLPDKTLGLHLRRQICEAGSGLLQIKITVVWDTPPCGLVEVDRRFRGAQVIDKIKSVIGGLSVYLTA